MPRVPYINVYKDIFIVEERIQMPLFFFLSGFLFKHLQIQGRYSSFKELLEKKIKRLLVPYIIGGGVIYLTCPDEVRLNINPIDRILHLWFILTLFWCFLFQYGVNKITQNGFLSILIGMIMEILMRQIPSILCINGLFSYFIYFTLAYSIPNINKLFDSNSVVSLSFGIFVIGALMCIHFEGRWTDSVFLKTLHHLAYFLTSISSILCIFGVFKKILYKSYLWIEDILDRCSFGIYIVHYWIMINLISLPFIQELMTDHYILYPLGMFIILSFSSLLIVLFLIRVPIIKDYI